MKKILVIGGGPAGIFAALNSKNENTEVCLIERNSKIGRKLAITGKGRCNITNDKDISEFFPEINRNANFCYSPLYTYTNNNLMDYFQNRGLKIKTERGGRVFPKSDNSFDVIDTLRNDLIKNDIEITPDTFVNEIYKNNKFLVNTNNGTFQSDALIIASGGISYPQTGSDGSLFKVIKSLGHSIQTLMPSLVPIELKDNWIDSLSGVTLKNVSLKTFYKNKLIADEFGEMLFTHTGISGPITLKTSTFLDEGKDYKLSLDLKPALDFDELDLRIQNDFKKYANKDFKNALGDLTINALIPFIIKFSKIDPNKVVHQITKKERHTLVSVFKDFPLTYKSLKEAKYGIITRGGVSVNEINPSTMESKIIEDLYFAGEVIDVDANTGGYNLQFAFSSGYLAGYSCGGKL